MTTKLENVAYAICSKCDITKTADCFYSKGNVCRECNNSRRRTKYMNDEDYRKKAIQTAIKVKQDKALVKQKIREEEQLKIGMENKQCKYCCEIKHKDRFRHNRLKCKDCERDEPREKLKRYVRTRIYNCLRYKNKDKSSIEYLGCSSDDYFKWILNYNNKYNLDNHGKEWHIDHVIPLSKFDLNNPQEQLIAFNWVNTMPLSPSENLRKNNKILQEQVSEHYKKVIQYHKENNIELPKEYINLFAKHLVDGDTLKLSLPLTIGNSCEDHD
jgi:hypothetical protein